MVAIVRKQPVHGARIEALLQIVEEVEPRVVPGLASKERKAPEWKKLSVLEGRALKGPAVFVVAVPSQALGVELGHTFHEPAWIVATRNGHTRQALHLACAHHARSEHQRHPSIDVGGAVQGQDVAELVGEHVVEPRSPASAVVIGRRRHDGDPVTNRVGEPVRIGGVPHDGYRDRFAELDLIEAIEALEGRIRKTHEVGSGLSRVVRKIEDEVAGATDFPIVL